jgi:hypothetical protein
LSRLATLTASVALLLSASLADAQPRRPMRGGPMSANPSAIVSAELGFARLAQEKGQWTAFRETADKDAVMFVPDAVNAQTWLKKRADPPKAIAWQPYRVFVSCDGSYALSTGPWTRPDGSTGTFSTIWRRQKDGGYKWVIDFGSGTQIPPQEEVMIEGRIAKCGPGMRRSADGPDEGIDGRPPRGERGDGQRESRQDVVLIPNPPPASGDGQSNDGSLRWRWTKSERDTSFVVTLRAENGEQTVLNETAPGAAS